MSYQYFYRFENNTNDASGSNNGTRWGSSAYAPSVDWQGANFTATTQYVFSGAVTGASTGATYSAWCWINTTAVPWWQARFWSGYNAWNPNTSLSIWFRANRWIVDWGDTSPSVTSTTAINDGKRHHVVGTRTSWGNKVLFIDGKQEASAVVWGFETMNWLASYLNGYDTSVSQKFTHIQTNSFFDNTARTPVQVKNQYSFNKWFM